MPAKDILHDVVKDALTHDGWIITHDPFVIPFGKRNVYADLAAEQALLAERSEQKIVVEIKSFVGLSRMNDLQQALGQYLLYRILLAAKYPEYELYIALDDYVFGELFDDADGQMVLKESELKAFTVDAETRRIRKWLKQIPIENWSKTF